MSKSLLFFGVGGVAVAGTGTGVGIYYGVSGSGKKESRKELYTPTASPPATL